HHRGTLQRPRDRSALPHEHPAAGLPAHHGHLPPVRVPHLHREPRGRPDVRGPRPAHQGGQVMATITTTQTQQRSAELNVLARKQRSLWLDAWYRLRRNRAAMAGLVVIAVACLVAIFAPVIAPHDPTAQDTPNQLMDPFFVSSKFKMDQYPLGSDQLGRDILS